jgi:hypothetical protein
MVDVGKHQNTSKHASMFWCKKRTIASLRGDGGGKGHGLSCGDFSWVLWLFDEVGVPQISQDRMS